MCSVCSINLKDVDVRHLPLISRIGNEDYLHSFQHYYHLSILNLMMTGDFFHLYEMWKSAEEIPDESDDEGYEDNDEDSDGGQGVND